jgi:ATP-dependent helicase HrpB
MKSDEQMLVFVPGIREVNEIVEILRRIFKRQAYPVTANQNPIEQEKNLRIGAIFIATAIAETSLTFRNLKYVIDSRISRLRCFNTEYELMETE